MATRYGRSVGGNWSAAGTWSATSGGGSDGSGLATGDVVVLDAASGAGVFTIDAAFSIASIDCTGFAGTLTHNAFGTTITGNTVKFVPGMTYTAAGNNRILSFTSTSGTTLITTAGKTLGGVVINGAGGTFQLQDALSIRSDGNITVTSGSFDANNFNVTAGGLYSTTAGVTRAITMGNGTWTLTSTSGSVVEFTSAAGNLTLSAASCHIVVNAVATNTRTLSLGVGKTYGTITLISAGNNTNTTDLTAGVGGVTIATLNIVSPNIVRLTATVPFTVTNPVAWAGTGHNNVFVLYATSASFPAMALASGSTMDWTAIGGINFTSGSPVATNSFDMKGNYGISILPPGAVSGGTMVNEPGAPTMAYNIEYPNPSPSTSMIMAASTTKVAMLGQVWHPTKKTGIINIRKVHFRTGAQTLNAASEVRVSLQNVSATAGPPYQPDGTQDQFYDFKAATVPLAASAVNITGNLSADRVVDLAAINLTDVNSSWLAVVWEFNVFNTSDSVLINCIIDIMNRMGLGGNTLLYTGSWVATANRLNNIVLECDDGTFAFLQLAMPNLTFGSASLTSNGAIRRGGLRFSVATARVIDRASLALPMVNGVDGRLVLYDGDGITELASVNIDNDAVHSIGSQFMEVIFPPVALIAGVFYRFVFVATTTTATSMIYFDTSNAAYLDGMYLGQNAHWTQHNGTVWADTLTRVPVFGLGVSATHGGTAAGVKPTYQIGI